MARKVSGCGNCRTIECIPCCRSAVRRIASQVEEAGIDPNTLKSPGCKCRQFGCFTCMTFVYHRHLRVTKLSLRDRQYPTIFTQGGRYDWDRTGPKDRSDEI
jgi:hypothetical protein